MKKPVLATLAVAMFLVVLTGCSAKQLERIMLVDTGEPEPPLIYDASVPAEQTATLTQGAFLTIKKFNGKSVSWEDWMTGKKRVVILPAGEHDFVVDYEAEGSVHVRPGERQVNPGDKMVYTADDIAVRLKLEAGHEYRMVAVISETKTVGAPMRRVGIDLRDDTEVLAKKRAERKRWREEFKASLPQETSKPTKFEGTWKMRGNNNHISFKGNTWEDAGDRTPEKGLFIISNDTLKFFHLFRQKNNGEWGSVFDTESDVVSINNNVSEHRFIFETDGGLRLQGHGVQGTFYKE